MKSKVTRQTPSCASSGPELSHKISSSAGDPRWRLVRWWRCSGVRQCKCVCGMVACMSGCWECSWTHGCVTEMQHALSLAHRNCTASPPGCRACPCPSSCLSARAHALIPLLPCLLADTRQDMALDKESCVEGAWCLPGGCVGAPAREPHCT